MKITAYKQHWFAALGLALLTGFTSMNTQAASREDVIIGVIAGAAVGYALSEHSSKVHVAYKDHQRPKYHHHQHYTHAHCNHYDKHHHGKAHYNKHYHSKHQHSKYHEHKYDHPAKRSRYSHSEKHQEYKARWSHNNRYQYNHKQHRSRDYSRAYYH